MLDVLFFISHSTSIISIMCYSLFIMLYYDDLISWTITWFRILHHILCYIDVFLVYLASWYQTWWLGGQWFAASIKIGKTPECELTGCAILWGRLQAWMFWFENGTMNWDMLWNCCAKWHSKCVSHFLLWLSSSPEKLRRGANRSAPPSSGLKKPKPFSFNLWSEDVGILIWWHDLGVLVRMLQGIRAVFSSNGCT